MKTCRISLNYSDFDEHRYLFVPFTFDLESYQFIDHWDDAVESDTVPDGMRCVGYTGDSNMYGDKINEIRENDKLRIGVAIMQDENGEFYVE